MKAKITFGAGGTIGNNVYLCGGLDAATNAATAKCYMLHPDRGFWKYAGVDMTSGLEYLCLLNIELTKKYISTLQDGLHSCRGQTLRGWWI